MTEKSKTAAAPKKILKPVDLFNRKLAKLVKPGAKLGVAVSGGPDSLALLHLAAKAKPGKIEAATVDHGLREDSRKEAEDVAALCKELGVPHQILTVEWDKKPESGLQRRARDERYKLLGHWANERGIDVLMTAHHADDQAETLLMRLARGSGITGLAGMRQARRIPNSNTSVVRPLLKWSHADLVKYCEKAGLKPANDPSNEDSRFERVRVREFLSSSDWLKADKLAKAAANMGKADAALRWATKQEFKKRVSEKDGKVEFDADAIPEELARRIIRKIIKHLQTEGRDIELRGRELDTLMNALQRGGRVTIRGVACKGGKVCKFQKAPPRKAVPAKKAAPVEA